MHTRITPHISNKKNTKMNAFRTDEKLAGEVLTLSRTYNLSQSELIRRALLLIISYPNDKTIKTLLTK